MKPGGFRLLLALAVVASHLTRFDVGRLAVLLFFFLSGFWVAKIWREKFDGDILRFYGARAMRIFPLYWLVTGLALILLPQPIGLSNLLLLGVANSAIDPASVSWSLDIEMQFYLALPFLLLMPMRWVLAVASAVAIIAWARWPDTLTLALYLPAFALGMATFTEDWRPSRKLALLSLAGFGAASVIAALTPFLDKTRPDPFNIDVFSFFWMLPLLPFVANSLRVRSGPLDRHLGNLSFPLYLVHAPVIAALAGHGKPVLMLGACVVALILYHGFDRPVDALRVWLFEGRPAKRPILAKPDPLR